MAPGAGTPICRFLKKFSHVWVRFSVVESAGVLSVSITRCKGLLDILV